MTTDASFIRHKFGGGWATDFGPTVDIAPDRSGSVTFPFLIDADNCIYEFDGGPHKAHGTSKVNSSALQSGAKIRGLFDYWITGTSGSPAQHRICHVDTTIKKDDANGTFTDLFTGLSATSIPSYSVLEDLLVMAQTGSDVPKSWDGTTAQNLAGTPPNFSWCVKHKNRMWAGGVAANPGRLYYSANLDGADWVGAGSGSIDIDPRDGDELTGAISHKNELWVFKGPYKGSIHRIAGSAPTGDDAFARKTFVEGLGAVAHNLIFRFGDDIGFVWSDGSVRSLAATAAFGDFQESALSTPIATFIRQRVNHNTLKFGHAENWPEMGMVVLTVPIDGSSDPNFGMMMDYRFLLDRENPGIRWAPWPEFDFMTALATVWDAGDKNRTLLWSGGNDGFVRKHGEETRSIDGTMAITFTVTTPFNTYGSSDVMKTLDGGSLGIAPKNDGSVTFGWTRDDNAQQTQSVSQGGGDVLAPADANQFTLGTSALAGSRFVDRFFSTEEGGEFRAVQYQVTQAANNEDVELHSISSIIQIGAQSLEN